MCGVIYLLVCGFRLNLLLIVVGGRRVIELAIGVYLVGRKETPIPTQTPKASFENLSVSYNYMNSNVTY